MSPRQATPTSGFVRHDYVLVAHVGDDERRARLDALCAGPWLGDEIVPGTWEISTDLSPGDLETAVLEVLGEGDRAAYYYLSDTKRIFRVVLC